MKFPDWNIYQIIMVIIASISIWIISHTRTMPFMRRLLIVVFVVVAMRRFVLN